MTRLPADFLERPPEESVRLLALTFLKEANDARLRFSDPQDTESLHDFRVAVRRLRSCCRAFRPWLEDSVSKKLRRELRELTRATNAARDAEVLLEWVREQSPGGADVEREGVEWLVRRLEDRKAQGLGRLASDALQPFDHAEPRLRKRLGRFETTVHLDRRPRRTAFGRVVGKLVQSQAAELREQLAQVRGPGDAETAHRARITAKRLRYLLEPLARRGKRAKALVTLLKALQDLLGEIRDTQVLEMEIAQAVEQAGTEQALKVQQSAVGTAFVEGAAQEVERSAPELSGLSRVAESRLGELFGRLESEWLGGHGEPLIARIERFGAGLQTHRARHVEIERKYLLSGLPERAREVEAVEIDQGWIAGDIVHERIRRSRTTGSAAYMRNIKLGGGIARSEYEEPMTAAMFDTLWPLTEHRRVSKRRYPVPDGDHTWEIDEFTDRELFLAEVEVASEEEAVEIPGWLKPHVVREVTGEPEYVNLNLAK